MDWTVIAVACIGLLGSGVVGGLIGSKANAAKAISEAAINMIKPLDARICALTKRVNALSKANRELRRGVSILNGQLYDNKILPQWEPPEWLGNEVG